MKTWIAIASVLSLGATTPNMGLPVDTPGVTSAYQAAVDAESAKQIIDQHDHSAGKGVPVTPAGLNINAPLPFNGNPATSLEATEWADAGPGPSVPLSDWTDGVDLWYEDGNGNKIKLTSGGALNVTFSLDGGSFNLALNRIVLPRTTIATSPYSILASGTTYYVGAYGAGTVELPAASSLSGFLVVVANETSTGSMVIVPSGSDTIAGTGASWTLPENMVVHLVSNGTSDWSLE